MKSSGDGETTIHLGPFVIKRQTTGSRIHFSFHHNIVFNLFLGAHFLLVHIVRFNLSEIKFCRIGKHGANLRACSFSFPLALLVFHHHPALQASCTNSNPCPSCCHSLLKSARQDRRQTTIMAMLMVVLYCCCCCNQVPNIPGPTRRSRDE